jgi:hypothetical protein
MPTQHREYSMKKLLLVVATVVTAGLVQKKMRQQKAEKDLWAEATDDSTK